MKITFKFLIMILLLQQNVHAQTKYNAITKIVGSIVDTKGDLLDYANIIVLNPSDSTATNMYYCYDGDLSIEIDNLSSNLLMVTSMGYVDKYIKLDIDESVISLGNIVMTASLIQMDEITVKANAPMVQRVGSKILVNVVSTPLVHLSSVMDIMKKVPGVFVKGEEIKIWGRGTPVIYIDGKLIKSYSEFTSLQPNEIISFQIDKNPSSLYAADVSSVISIKTNREKFKGYSLQLYNHSTLSREFSNTSGVRFNINHKKLRAHIDYRYDNLKNKDYQQDYDKNNQSSGLLQINDTSRSVYTRDNHEVMIGLGYNFNDKNDLSFQYIHTNKEYDGDEYSEQYNLRNEILDNILDVRTNKLNNTNTNIFSLAYKLTHNAKWETNLWSDYIFLDNTLNQKVIESSVSGLTSNDIKISNDASSDAYSIKLESKYSINDDAELIFGGRYGKGQSFTKSLSEYTTVPSVVAINDIQENNLAIYFQYSHDFSKFGYELGLRAENNVNKTLTNDINVRDVSDFELFPSMAIYTNELFDNVDLSLSYTNKVSRPKFNQYNPIKYYINSYCYNIGNPNLISTKQHSFSFDVSLFENLSLWASYDYDKNPIVQTGVQDSDDPELINYTFININKFRMWDIGAYYGNKWDWFSMSVISGVNIPNTDIPYMNTIIHNNKLSYYLQLSLDMELAKNSYFSTSYNYEGKGVDQITTFDATHDLSSSFTQYICKRKWALILSANDILRKSYAGWVDKYNNVESGQTNSMDSRSLRLTLRYNFKNFKNNYKKQTNYNQELQRLQ